MDAGCDLLSDNDVSIEDIADLCEHSGATVTATVYRHQLWPVLPGRGGRHGPFHSVG